MQYKTIIQYISTLTDRKKKLNPNSTHFLFMEYSRHNCLLKFANLAKTWHQKSVKQLTFTLTYLKVRFSDDDDG